MSDLKKQQTPENEEEIKSKIEEKRIEGSLFFILLKKLNRLDKLRIRAGRDALNAEKIRVDNNKLQLHNLAYEAEHLKKEVKRCHEFKSQDEEIELVPVEEFFEKAPASISRPVSRTFFCFFHKCFISILFEIIYRRRPRKTSTRYVSLVWNGSSSNAKTWTSNVRSSSQPKSKSVRISQ